MFIDARFDLSIDISHIEAVESIDELNCVVYTVNRSYSIPMPKGAFMSLINTHQESEPNNKTETFVYKLTSSGATPRP